MSLVVVGGGLSGLFTAIATIAAGEDDVVVVEKSDRPGGVAETISHDGFSLEPAVGSMTLPHPHLSPILDLIGAEMVAAPAEAATRYLFVDGRLVEIPASPRALLAPVLSWRGRVRAMGEVLRSSTPPIDEVTLARFCTQHFGDEVGQLMAWLMASGVFAGDPDLLSAQAAFPQLVTMARDHGSLIRGMMRRRRDRPTGLAGPRVHYPAAGLTELARRATRFLGSRYRGGFEVASVRRDRAGWVVAGPEVLRARSVVVSTHPLEAATLLDEELGAQLAKARSAPVAVVGLGGRGEQVVPNGLGALVGPGEGLASLGFLFESEYAPERAPEQSWLIKVIAGGATQPDLVESDRIAEIARSEAERVLSRELDPSFIEVARHRRGIPQYNVGHVRWLKTLDLLLEDRPGLDLTGWGYRGVGVGHLATDARRVAARVADRSS